MDNTPLKTGGTRLLPQGFSDGLTTLCCSYSFSLSSSIYPFSLELTLLPVYLNRTELSRGLTTEILKQSPYNTKRVTKQSKDYVPCCCNSWSLKLPDLFHIVDIPQFSTFYSSNRFVNLLLFIFQRQNSPTHTQLFLSMVLEASGQNSMAFIEIAVKILILEAVL